MNKRSLVFLVIGLLASVLTFLQCSKDSATGDNTKKIQTSTVKGSVVDKRGNGLSGVAITSVPGGYSTTSDLFGNFEIPDIQAETYSFHFHLADYRDTVSGPIELGLDDVVTLPAPMKLTFRFATLRGVVLSKTSAPLFGAGVTVEKQGVYTISYTDGEYTLTRVEPGDIRVMSALPGQGIGVREFSAVPDSEYTGVDIPLDLDGGSVSGALESASPRALAKGLAVKGSPLVRAVVSAVGGVLKDTTDGQGVFTINGVPCDVDVMLTVVSAAGDTMRISGVEVGEDSAVNLRPVTFLDGDSVAVNDSTVDLMDYTPGTVGSIWQYHSAPGDSIQFDLTKRIDKMDTILGRSCWALSHILQRDSSHMNEWTIWLAQDTSGMLLCAFGSNIDSAAIFDPPKLWLPGVRAGVGYAWDVHVPEMGGHFWFSITSLSASVSVPADSFSNCLKLHLVTTDSTGDTTQRNDYYHARNAGEVLNQGWNSMMGGSMNLELQSYTIP